jgi:hypothetical protein
VQHLVEGDAELCAERVQRVRKALGGLLRN